MRYSVVVLSTPSVRRRFPPWSPFVAVLVALTTGCSGCSGDDPECVDVEVANCAPLYHPTWEEVFSRTIAPRCAVEGGACHSGSDAKGGLRMDDIDETYSQLVGDGRVLPGDASCSLLVIRIEGGGGVMPPGTPLSDAERCAVETWVADGAQR